MVSASNGTAWLLASGSGGGGPAAAVETPHAGIAGLRRRVAGGRGPRLFQRSATTSPRCHDGAVWQADGLLPLAPIRPSSWFQVRNRCRVPFRSGNCSAGSVCRRASQAIIPSEDRSPGARAARAPRLKRVPSATQKPWPNPWGRARALRGHPRAARGAPVADLEGAVVGGEERLLEMNICCLTTQPKTANETPPIVY